MDRSVEITFMDFHKPHSRSFIMVYILISILIYTFNIGFYINLYIKQHVFLLRNDDLHSVYNVHSVFKSNRVWFEKHKSGIFFVS